MKIRDKLFLVIVGSIVLTAVLLGWTASHIMEKFLLEQMESRLNEKAAKIAEQTELFIENRQSILSFLAKNRTIQLFLFDSPKVEVTQIQDLFLSVGDEFDDLVLMRTTGEEVVKMVNKRITTRLGQAAREEYFRQAQAQGVYENLAYQRSPEKGEVVFARQVMNPYEESAGVLAAKVNYGILASFLGGLQIGKGIMGGVVDSAGVYVSRAGETAPGIQRLMTPSQWERFTRNQLISREIVHRRSYEKWNKVVRLPLTQGESLLAYQVITGTPWVAVSVMSYADLYRQLSYLNKTILAVSFLVVIWGMFAALYLSHQWAKPLQTLLERSQMIAQGDYSARVNINRRDEIGELGKAFDGMTLNLEKVISDLGESNENLEHQRVQMEKTLGELTTTHQELKEAQLQIVQAGKLAAIGHLAAGVAHEINNPIGFVGSNLETLKEYFSRYDDLLKTVESMKVFVINKDYDKAFTLAQDLVRQEKDFFWDYISKDTNNLIKESLNGLERVKRIVLDLRTFSRADKGAFGLTNVEEVLDSVVNLTSSELKYKVRIERSYGRIPPVWCNQQKISQVFINILINAVQAITGTGVVTLKTFVEDGYACVAIGDTGCGITPDNLEKIFEPFFTTKPVGAGTGLGLSISYEIVKRSGGDITVSSQVGQGTSFVVKLPLGKPATAPDSTAGEPPA